MPIHQSVTPPASRLDLLPSTGRPGEIRSIFFCILAFWLATVVLGALSDGVHHDDDLVHFLMARWAWTYPGYLLHIWGRPGATLPLAMVSGLADVDLAWHTARLLSSTVSAVCAWLAAGVARSLGVSRCWRVTAACYVQPLFAMLGYTTLTENFTAFYLIAATALLLKGRAHAASLVFSLALLTRHEAIIFLPLWMLVVLLYKPAGRRRGVSGRVAAAAVSLWAPLVHNLLYRWQFGGWPATIFFRPSGSTEYLATGWADYVPDAAYAVTPLIGILALVGAANWLYGRRGEGDRSSPQGRQVARLWVIGMPLIFFAAHTAICALGVFASGGFPRFMVAVSPFVAILAVVGWDVLLAGRVMPGRAVRGWLITALAWGMTWLALESEARAGRLPVASQNGWIAMRVILGVFLVGSLVASLNRQRIVTLFRPGLLACLLLVVAGQWIFIVRPLRLKPAQEAARQVVRRLDEHGLSDRPIFATNPWIVFGLGLIENSRSLKNAELLASMPVGTIFVWDTNYTSSDYHAIEAGNGFSDKSYRHLWESSGEEGVVRFRVYEKVEPTPMPGTVKPSYPPPIQSTHPPVRGIYYVRDSYRPSAWSTGSPSPSIPTEELE